jgi:hypothetical protein
MVRGHDTVLRPRRAGDAPAVQSTLAQEIRLEIKVMRTFTVLATCVLLVAMVACARPQKYIDITCAKMPGEGLLDREAAIQCQRFREEEAATAAYSESTLLLKSYRACLDKYEQMPARAREYCGLYGKALSQRWEPRDCQVGETLLDRQAAIQCQQFRQEAAATAVYHEATLLLQSYRACLDKYEQMPARAREYCGEYGKALQNIGLQIKEPLDTSPPTRGTAQSQPKLK